MSERLVFIVDSSNVDSRLDKYLSLQLQIASRSRAEFLISENLVTVNGKSTKSSYKVKAMDSIEVQLPQKSESHLQPLDLKLDIKFEDSDLLVVNKPSGLVVHPAAGHQNDTLVNALLAHTKDLSMKFGEDRPGIVHRIDKDTSGLLVIAKNDRTHQALSDQFKKRTILRLYEAVCLGTPRLNESKITSVLARHPTDRKRFASMKDSSGRWIQEPPLDSTKTHPVGKIAITNFKVLSSRSTASLLELKLYTGRTHQIRVHMSEFGNPLVGDTLYYGSHSLRKVSSQMKADIDSLNRFLLHAKVLGFVHPVTNQPLRFEVDWPTRDKDFIEKWFK